MRALFGTAARFCFCEVMKFSASGVDLFVKSCEQVLTTYDLVEK